MDVRSKPATTPSPITTGDQTVSLQDLGVVLPPVTEAEPSITQLPSRPEGSHFESNKTQSKDVKVITATSTVSPFSDRAHLFHTPYTETNSRQALQLFLQMHPTAETFPAGTQSLSVECWSRSNKQFVVKFINEYTAKRNRAVLHFMYWGRGESISLDIDPHPNIAQTHCLLLKTDECAPPCYAIATDRKEWEEKLPDMYLKATVCDRAPGYDLCDLFNMATYKKHIGDPHWILPIMLNMTDALIHLHDRNIMHRDVKIENVIFDPISKCATLIDFGFAEKLQPNTRASWVCGTAETFSPEMLAIKLRKPSQGYGLEIDDWGLGMILLFLLTNRLVSENEVNDAKATAERQRKRPDAKEIYQLKLNTCWSFSQLDHLQKKDFLEANAPETISTKDPIINKLRSLTAHLLMKEAHLRMPLHQLKDELLQLKESLDTRVETKRQPFQAAV